LSRQDAIDAVLKAESSEFAVVDEWVTELARHWLLFVQSKRYIETRDQHDLLIGLGGILVEKATGRLTYLSSAHAQPAILDMYEGGCFDFWNPDIVITAVDDMDEAVGLLAALRMTWVVPEVVSGDTFRIPTDYTVEQLRAHVSRLPCRFNIRSLYFRW